jgi:hypothetical protein
VIRADGHACKCIGACAATMTYFDVHEVTYVLKQQYNQTDFTFWCFRVTGITTCDAQFERESITTKIVSFARGHLKTPPIRSVFV